MPNQLSAMKKRETVAEHATLLAALAGLKPCYFPIKPSSNEIGHAMPKDSADTPMLIEVLRWVYGASRIIPPSRRFVTNVD